MEILGPNSTSSSAFTIAEGKQITISATGLTGSDIVAVEILELSSAPPFNGNPCCNLDIAKIEVLRRTPLLCPDGRPVQLTADYPYGVLDAPQGVALGVTLIADPSSVIHVNVAETESSGCTACICDRPCEDTVWTSTGDYRCIGTDVQRKEESNCGNDRWVIDRPQAWVATGETRCRGTNVEAEEVNDCGATRWVVQSAQVWIATGETRCVNNVVENEEVNDCGRTRWTPTTTACGFCASYPQPRDMCDGVGGYLFRDGDVKDPAATVAIVDCDGVETVYAYPAAGPGHSIPVVGCGGTVLGYAANTSACVQNEQAYLNIQSLPELHVAPIEIAALPKLEIGPLTIESLPELHVGALEIASLPELKLPRTLVSAVQVGNEVWTYWSDGTKQVEKLPDTPVVVTYCPSMRLSCDGNESGFGFHLMDPKDPAATVEMASCDSTEDSIWIYPSAGPGHTLKKTDCDGNVIGYAANTSDCATDCGC